jgi:uncharacterized protein with von Willebrand factor type A (vWA) domain
MKASAASLPLPAAHLIGFGQLIRGHGFLATVDHGTSFLRAVALLGPRSMGDIYRAAHAIYGPDPQRRGLFDQLFDAHFLGRYIPELGASDEDSETEVNDDPDGQNDPVDMDEINDAGEQASAADIASARQLRSDQNTVLNRFAGQAARQLPHRRTRRRRPAHRGDSLDMRAVLRRALRTDGEILTLPKRRPVTRLRPILLLIDVSGSMKDHSDAYFRFAHALKHAAGQVEVFTLGTQLTRVSAPLALRNRDQALARVSAVIPDWDGGTRLGDTLAAMLSVPRFSGLARGAFVITLSDGLERGTADALSAAVTKIGRLAWTHLWLTPLAQTHHVAPQTQAMGQIAPILDGIGSAASPELICDRLLKWAQETKTPATLTGGYL